MLYVNYALIRKDKVAPDVVIPRSVVLPSVLCVPSSCWWKCKTPAHSETVLSDLLHSILLPACVQGW